MKRLAWAMGILCVVGVAMSGTAQARNVDVTILEVAPLRGIMGHPAVRWESTLWSQTALGLSYEMSDSASQRRDFKDRRRAFKAEGYWYPLSQTQQAPFLGSGLKWEQADIGRERLRDTLTWARTRPGETHDLWVNQDTYISWTQSLGYRWNADQYLTASLRLERDELLHSQSLIKKDAVVSSNPDLSSSGRAPVILSVVLHAGLRLQ